jgi:hypothetical protein
MSLQGGSEELAQDHTETDHTETIECISEDEPQLVESRDQENFTGTDLDGDQPDASSESINEPDSTSPVFGEDRALQPVTPAKPDELPLGWPPYLLSPSFDPEQEGAVKMVTVLVRSSGDRTRDVLRLRRLHGILISYPGNDRFAIHVFEKGRGYLLEFPNYTAGVCPEMISRLTALVGRENIRLETITFK